MPRLLLAMLLCMCLSASARESEVLRRMWHYPDSVRTLYLPAAILSGQDTVHTNVYGKYTIEVPRRNVLMWLIPEMAPLARSQGRSFFGETYSSVTSKDQKQLTSFVHLHQSTLPRHCRPMKQMQAYLSPDIYGVTLVDDHLLSPFHRSNRFYYRYRVEPYVRGVARVRITPLVANTQTVSGEAYVRTTDGKLLRCTLRGEYDMVSFTLHVTMGEDGLLALCPKRCEVQTSLRFIGNHVDAAFTSVSNLPTSLPTTLEKADSANLMDQLRPIPLLSAERAIVLRRDSLRVAAGQQSMRPAASSRRRTVDAVWNAIESNMLSSIRSDLGDERQQLRIGPLFNPLYMGYSGKRGVIYKFTSDFLFQYHPRRTLSASLQGGYAFKQQHLYYSFSLRNTFNSERQAYVEATVNNGNYITSSTLLDYLKQQPHADSIRFDQMELDYFRDLAFTLHGHYAFTPRLSASLGLVFHRRAAVNKLSFHTFNEPVIYRSLAPLIKIHYQPFGIEGLSIQGEWEHGIRGIVKESLGYDRLEASANYALSLPCTRRLAFSVGSGFYAPHKDGLYFLDYNHFRRNNISSGWSTDPGDFQLLDPHWFNASDIYFRAGSAYESPLLMLTHLPLVGKIVERERIYVNTLIVRRLAPYVETGYMLRNRFFSAGAFASFSRHGYESAGLTFALELFGRW